MVKVSDRHLNGEVSEEPRQNKGRGMVDRKLVEAPSNFIAGRPNAALLYWFFGYFRCGVI